MSWIPFIYGLWVVGVSLILTTADSLEVGPRKIERWKLEAWEAQGLLYLILSYVMELATK
jgi:hypothetical protein